MYLFFIMRETKCQIRLIYKGFNCKRKQDRLRMNDSTGSNSHLRSIDRFISMNIQNNRSKVRDVNLLPLSPTCRTVNQSEIVRNSQNVVRMQSECRQNVVRVQARMQAECIQNVVILQPECSKNVARIQSKYRQNLVQMQLDVILQPECNQKVARMQSECSKNIVKILSECSPYVVRIQSE